MDDIVEEVHRVRQAYAERFGFDLAAIFRDARERGRESGREVVSLPPKRIVPTVDVPVVDHDETIPEASSTSANPLAT